MGDKNKKSANAASHGPGEYRAVFSHSWLNPKTLTPAIVYTQQKRERNYPLPRLSLWERFNTWIRYYSVQWRWDIERKLARLLHHSWIG